MRVLFCLLLALPAFAAAPDFALQQERRCPKMPDGDDWYRAHAAPSEPGLLDGGLLICHVEILPKRSSAWQGLSRATLMGGPDLLVTLSTPAEKNMWLWGPENHWKSFVSWPNVTLRKGDAIDVRLWDRDVFGKEALGGARVKWDGRFPLRLEGKRFVMSCVAMTQPEALAAAQPRLARADADLAAIERTPADITRAELGRPIQIHTLKGMFGHPLRYPAGFLGWDHPEIKRRLDRLRDAEAGFEARARAAVDEAVQHAPVQTDAFTAGPVVCTRKGCVLGIGVRTSTDLGDACSDGALRTVSLIGRDGREHLATLQPNTCAAYDLPAAAARDRPVLVRIGRAPVVLRLPKP
jgi:hypothetical protein